jgi:hypothetical protein
MFKRWKMAGRLQDSGIDLFTDIRPPSPDVTSKLAADQVVAWAGSG